MHENEAGRLRALMRNSETSVWFTKHARQEMANDGIARIDIENMLRRCQVSLVEIKRNEETWRAEGADSDGRSIIAVVVAYEDVLEVKIITAWTK